MQRFKDKLPTSIPQTDRIWKTSIEPYNQVIALTQWRINEGIQGFYTYLKGKKQVPKATYKPNKLEWLKNVEFGPPFVLIDVKPLQITSVRLTINIIAGDLHVQQFYQEPKPNDDPPVKELDVMADLGVSNLTVTVPCNIDFTTLDLNTDRGKEMAKRMRVKDHSIYQLLVSLASAAWGEAQYDLGKWTDNDWISTSVDGEDPVKSRPQGYELGRLRDRSTMDPNLANRFASFVREISRQLVETGMLTMGYMKSFDQPTNRPTFEVNNSRFQTYPWTDTNGQSPLPALTGDARLNYLCYLETVGTNTPPPFKDIKDPSKIPVLPVNGNWTDGRDPTKDPAPTFSTFKLSKKCFLEDYFIPKLENLNRLMEFRFIDASMRVYWDGLYLGSSRRTVMDIGSTYTGENVASDPAYRFNERTPIPYPDEPEESKKFFSEWFTPSTPLPKGTLQWFWSSKSSLHKNDRGGSGADAWNHCYATNKARVVVVPGTNMIYYQGASWIKNDWVHDSDWGGSKMSGGATVQVKWDVICTMSEVEEGGLYFSFDSNNDKFAIEVPWDDNSGGFKSETVALYTQPAKNFERVVNGLRDPLKEQNLFVMPSSGVYFFKNPLFDHSGNLITELSYNGIQEFDPIAGGKANPDGMRDPGVAKPDFQDFKKVAASEASAKSG